MELTVTIADWYERAPASDWLIRTVVLLLAALPMISFAQGIQLTPAQQQMLNSLPAAQRQQAMSALQQLQVQQPAPPAWSCGIVIDCWCLPLHRSLLLLAKRSKTPRTFI